MTSPTRLMAGGIPALPAAELGMASAPSILTATGSTYATALTLKADFNLFGTVASGTGCVLPVAEAQPPKVVYNGGANALLVYPQATDIINGGTVGATLSVASGKSAVFYQGRNTSVSPAIGGWIALVSA